MFNDNTSGREISRRRFLRDAGLATAAATELLALPAAVIAKPTRPRRRRPTVAVLGGGVAGLTAAHELAERGFAVTVYERRAWGGKARSMDVPGSGHGSRRPLPAEHGWREFFGVYQNLPETMSRIPFGANPHGVLDNLVPVPELMLGRAGGLSPLILRQATRPAYTPAEGIDLLLAALQWLSPADLAHFAQRMSVFLSSGDQRRLGQWEQTSWERFVQTERFSEGARRAIVEFATRFVVATHDDVASARTIGKGAESAIYMWLTGRGASKMLDAPTNEAWINPWVDLLHQLGVKLELGHTVTGVDIHDGRISGVHITNRRGKRTIRADWYVCALPVERARRLWSAPILRADPTLASMGNIKTGWMTGIQFYLTQPTPILDGPQAWLDSPWAVLTVSQAQLWTGRDLARDYGDGRVKEKLSAVVSDWNTPGIIYGKAARHCTPEQIAIETWTQIKRHLRYPGAPKLTDDMLVSWFLDPGISTREGRIVGNEDPLFLPTVNSWNDRPTVATSIPNLFLAADYVQVDFDITSMEGANEAARRAVTALLSQAGSAEAPPTVFERQLPIEWKLLRDLDDERYKQGQPNIFDTQTMLGQLKDSLNQIGKPVGIKLP